MSMELNGSDVTQSTTRTRTPRNAETITKGALDLPLADRVALRKALDASITKEVADLQAAAKLAEETAKG